MPSPKQLNDVTDAMFWSTYSDRLGRHLDPHDPNDHVYVDAWRRIYHDVARGWRDLMTIDDLAAVASGRITALDYAQNFGLEGGVGLARREAGRSGSASVAVRGNRGEYGNGRRPAVNEAAGSGSTSPWWVWAIGGIGVAFAVHLFVDSVKRKDRWWDLSY